MIDIYTNLATPPTNALKTIQAGNLRGKSDINPQWKIEAITAQFGLCGIGWKFEILDKTIYPLEDKQILLYMTVALFIKNADILFSAVNLFAYPDADRSSPYDIQG
jgi:hypothetical protein